MAEKENRHPPFDRLFTDLELVKDKSSFYYKLRIAFFTGNKIYKIASGGSSDDCDSVDAENPCFWKVPYKQFEKTIIQLKVEKHLEDGKFDHHWFNHEIRIPHGFNTNYYAQIKIKEVVASSTKMMHENSKTIIFEDADGDA